MQCSDAPTTDRIFTPTFGPSNPPSDIWAAHERPKHSEGTEEKRKRDREVVESFVRHHGLFEGAKPTNLEAFPTQELISGNYSQGEREEYHHKTKLRLQSVSITDFSFYLFCKVVRPLEY